MIRRLVFYIILASLLFSSSVLILHREPVELIATYTIWFASLYMLLSMWLSGKLGTPLNLVMERFTIGVKINANLAMHMVEFSIIGIVFGAMVESLSITLWQYLILISLLFIVYRVLLRLPIKKMYRYLALLSALIISYILGFINSNAFNRLDEHFSFIEDIMHGIG